MKAHSFRNRTLSFLLAIVMLLGVVPVVVFSTSAGSPTTSGIYFTADETYTMKKSLSGSALTVETTVCLPSGYSDRGGIIVGNYGDVRDCFGIEIHQNGQPRIYITGGSYSVDVRFPSACRVDNGSFTHLAITMDLINGIAHCYINGELKGTLTGLNFPPEFYTETVYMIGGDYRSSNSQYFKGAMGNLALYSDIRTAEEIASDYKNGTDLTDEALLCAYDFTLPGDAKLADLSANEVDLVCSNAIGGADFEKSATFKTPLLDANPETLEAWLYVPAGFVGRAGCIFGNYPEKLCLNFEIYDNGKPRLYYLDSAGKEHDHTFSCDVRGMGWVHVALVHDAANSQALCYINGALAATITNNVAALDAALKNTVFAVGSDVREGNGQYFKGRLRSVAVWNDVRTETEIADSYANGIKAGSEGLLAHYNVVASGIERLKDLSGNGMHLTYAGNDAQYSLANAGISFASDYVLPISKAFSAPAETMSAWVYVPSTAPNRVGCVMGNYNGRASFNFEIYYSNQPRLYYREADGTAHSFVFSDAKLASDTWTYVTLVHDVAKEEVRCYLNGVLKQTLTADEAGNGVAAYEAGMFANAPVVGSDLQIPTNPQYFKGRLAAVSAYSDVRTDAEIAAEYRRGADKDDAELIAAYDLTLSGPMMLQDKSGNGHQLVDETLGSVFNFETTYRTAKNYGAAPETFQAWVYIPKTYTARPGVILGSYYSASCINFEIQTGGKPRLYYNGATSGTRSFVFPLDVRGAWTHVTIVHDVENAQVLCYLNGSLAGTLTKDASGNGVNAYDAGVTDYAFNIGGDVQSGNLQYFKGRLSGVTLYSDIRTADEIREDYLRGADLLDRALLASYAITDNSTYADIPDLSGNGYHMKSQFRNIWVDADQGQYTGDYDYSMALVGDTQALAYRHSSAGYTTAMPTLYQWIVDHVESKNIQYVMGLGDITEQDTAAEWEYAKAAITKMDGIVPYSLIWGMNHDTPASLDAYFADHTPFTDNISGVYTEGSITNAYYNFEVGTTKYMIMALDFGAKDHVLDWASEIIAANPDRRVIITTHGYLNYDGSTLDPSESYAPSASYYDPENNDGDDIWEKLASQHANICMVFSGHITTDSVVISQQTGVHGNTVTQLLVDPQGIDGEYANGTGMVAMLYFSNGGKDVAVEYYSTIRDKYLPLQTFSVETVAKNGTEEYTTLTEALGAAMDGDTVTLTTNTSPVTQLVVPNAITLDLDGKTLTLPALDDYALLAKDALTVKNGAMHATGNYGIGTVAGSSLFIQSGSYTAVDGCTAFLGGTGSIVVTGGTFSAELPDGVAGDGYVIAQATESGLYTVIPNTYFEFLGGSLRYGDAVPGKTNIRFGYQFAEDFDWEASAWRWSFGYADSAVLYEGNGVNKTEDGISSLVIANVPLANYRREIRVRLMFEVTHNGVDYTVYDVYQYRSVLGVAEAILQYETESTESIAYAESIVAEVNAAQ